MIHITPIGYWYFGETIPMSANQPSVVNDEAKSGILFGIQLLIINKD